MSRGEAVRRVDRVSLHTIAHAWKLEARKRLEDSGARYFCPRRGGGRMMALPLGGDGACDRAPLLGSDEHGEIHRRLDSHGSRSKAGVGAVALLVASYMAAWAIAASRTLKCWVLRTTQGLAGDLVAGGTLAVHAEDSNRVMHLVRLVSGSPNSFASLVFIGRVRARGLRQALARIRAEGASTSHTVLPVGWRGLWIALALSGQVVSVIRSLHLRGLPIDSFAARVATLTRIIHGMQLANWTSGQPVEGGTWILGHAGTADTTIIERALHISGAMSCHLVHGVSDGHVWDGTSDVGVFRCGWDARHYRSFSGYRRCVTFGLPCPEYHAGPPLGGAVLLLSNIAHPTNPLYCRGGVSAACRVIRATCKSIMRVFGSERRILYRPHPSFYTLPRAEQDRVQALIAGIGVGFSPRGSSLEEEILCAHDVVCSRSSTIIDVMSLGRVPLTFDVDAEDPPHICDVFPKLSDLADNELRDSLVSGERDRAHHQRLWEEVAPGRWPSLQELWTLLEGGAWIDVSGTAAVARGEEH